MIVTTVSTRSGIPSGQFDSSRSATRGRYGCGLVGQGERSTQSRDRSVIGVLKFVARSEDEFRAYLDAAIEAAREPYDRGNALRLDVGKPASWEPGGDDDELAEPAPQAAPRPFQGTYKRAQRARDLAGTVFPVSDAVILAAARKAFISAAWSSFKFVASVILSLDRPRRRHRWSKGYVKDASAARWLDGIAGAATSRIRSQPSRGNVITP
jgi:hypothetical protein